MSLTEEVPGIMAIESESGDRIALRRTTTVPFTKAEAKANTEEKMMSMDWDKVSKLLGVVKEAHSWPKLWHLRDAAMAELEAIPPVEKPKSVPVKEPVKEETEEEKKEEEEEKEKEDKAAQEKKDHPSELTLKGGK